MTILTLNICQIVGYKNSGKTTLTGNLIKAMQSMGLEVATVKHHGHVERDPFIVGDSGHHFKSGATLSSVVSPSFAHFSYLGEPPLEAWLAFYSKLPSIKWVLVEGYKAASFPKLLLIKDLEEWKGLSHLSHILAVVTDSSDVQRQLGVDFPLFGREDVSELLTFLLESESRCHIHESF